MPVLDTERRSATRSALRYRPVETDQPGAEPLVTRQRRSRPDALGAVASVTSDDYDNEEAYAPRQHRSSPPAVARKSTPPARTRRRVHPLFFIGAGLLIAIVLWAGLTQLIAWGTNEYNTLVYGYPRTFQIDAVVGHNDSAQHPSHFMAVNLRGSINIIEFPGSDPSRTRVFVFSNVQGSGADLAVVTLRFVDVNHNGLPDMAIDIGGVQGVLINDGKTFRLPTSVEQQQVVLFLRQHP